ncbi:Tetratricopeptide repeat protein 12 [Frankliniella fusca]|uniref:Tetratricopeptide repeat protein 12 n=1 Tax=Frankliniella fusca TaxID=407009 RepID=A0AAE1LV16_9NEOP|nr:Tetratricopeptide repeat protein 12 [Frankliniella fusca]
MAEDEFDNFMERVTEVENLVKMLRCSDQKASDRAGRRAELLLRARQTSAKAQDDLLEGEGCAKPHPTLSCRDRTVINYKAFQQMGESRDPQEMSKEAFMAQVEKDAKIRAKDRQDRKQRSAQLKAKANEAFRQKKFEKALDFYNKAIDETRDSALLYENRALTLLHLELFQRVIDDCERALSLNDKSLKALLYKAKALFLINQEGNSEECLFEALQKYPQHHNLIQDYKKSWMNGKES